MRCVRSTLMYLKFVRLSRNQEAEPAPSRLVRQLLLERIGQDGKNSSDSYVYAGFI